MDCEPQLLLLPGTGQAYLSKLGRNRLSGEMVSVGLPGPSFCGDNRTFGRGPGYGGPLHRAPSVCSIMCGTSCWQQRFFVFWVFFVVVVVWLVLR